MLKFDLKQPLGMVQLRDDARRVLEKTYPQSAYLSSGFKSTESRWYKFW